MRHLLTFRRHRFLSLKWKMFWLLSIVLLAMYALSAWVQYQQFQRQFAADRLTGEQRVLDELRALLWRGGERLQQVAALVPQAYLCTAGQHPEIERFWANLQLNLGWDFMTLQRADGELRILHTPTDLFAFTPQDVRSWEDAVASPYAPRSVLACNQQGCGQFAAVPILNDQGQRCGTLTVGIGLAEELIDFLRLRRVAVGILLPMQPEGTTANVLQLARWQQQVSLLAGVPESSRVLQQLEYEQAQMPARTQVQVGAQTYAVWFAPMPVAAGQSAQWALLEDVSADLAQIAATNWDMLGNSLLALLVSEIVLLLLLWPALQRVQYILEALPLLGRNAFTAAREHFARLRHVRGLRDEIDLLQTAALDLTTQLEQLHHEAISSNEALNHQMVELVQERDFVSCLLDTAEVAILTTDTQGYITSANAFAERMFGYPETVLRTRRLREFYQSCNGVAGLVLLEQQVEVNRAQEETTIRHADGSLRTVAWWHSRLAVIMPLDATLLSVGLDITARKEAEARLTWLADHDALTGLYNRRRMELGLAEMVRGAADNNWAGALFFLDLDQFKEINDTSGHQAGDHLLKLIAAELRRMSADEDLVARLGGDEFALARPHCTEAQALKLAHQINQCLAEIGFSISGRQFRVSASIGVALFPLHGATVDDLLVSADLAMYHAKELGRGRPVLASNEIVQRGRMEQRLRWKERLQQALARDEFVLYYQPLLHVQTGQISHYEALLRLKNPDGTVVEPAIIIDIAERAGMIDRLTQLVIRKGVDTLARPEHAQQDWRLSLNLSAHDLQNPELLVWVNNALQRTGVAPERLIFEITETAAVADFVAARTMMEKIGALGCAFALDDFGVGFSSFYYLKQFDVDYIKIDGSFIQKIVTSRENQIFVQAIVQVARGLHKRIIAEFVEDGETLVWLAAVGVDYAQGYHIGRPQPHLPTLGGAGPDVDGRR